MPEKIRECKKRKQRQQPESQVTGSHTECHESTFPVISTPQSKEKKKEIVLQKQEMEEIKHMQIAQIVAQITTKDTIKE